MSQRVVWKLDPYLLSLTNDRVADFSDPKTVEGLDATLGRLQNLVARREDDAALTDADVSHVRAAVLRRLG